MNVGNVEELDALSSKNYLEGIFKGDFLEGILAYDFKIAKENHYSFVFQFTKELDYLQRKDWVQSTEVKDMEKTFRGAGDKLHKTSLDIQRGRYENYSLDALLRAREILRDGFDKSIELLGKYCELLKDKTAITPDYEKYFTYAGLIEENLGKRIEIKKRKLSEEEGLDLFR